MAVSGFFYRSQSKWLFAQLYSIGDDGRLWQSKRFRRHSLFSNTLSPVTSGIYAYTPAANLILAPNTGYFIVLTAAKTVANGAYDWSTTSTINFIGAASPGGFPNHGWQAPLGLAGIDIYQSGDGSNWNILYAANGIPQFALNATPIPEPSSGILFGVGGLLSLCLCVWHRSRTNTG